MQRKTGKWESDYCTGNKHQSYYNVSQPPPKPWPFPPIRSWGVLNTLGHGGRMQGKVWVQVGGETGTPTSDFLLGAALPGHSVGGPGPPLLGRWSGQRATGDRYNEPISVAHIRVKHQPTTEVGFLLHYSWRPVSTSPTPDMHPASTSPTVFPLVPLPKC